MALSDDMFVLSRTIRRHSVLFDMMLVLFGTIHDVCIGTILYYSVLFGTVLVLSGTIWKHVGNIAAARAVDPELLRETTICLYIYIIHKTIFTLLSIFK